MGQPISFQSSKKMCNFLAEAFLRPFKTINRPFSLPINSWIPAGVLEYSPLASYEIYRRNTYLLNFPEFTGYFLSGGVFHQDSAFFRVRF